MSAKTAGTERAWTRQQIMTAWQQVADHYYEDSEFNIGTDSAYDYQMTTLIRALLARLEKKRIRKPASMPPLFSCRGCIFSTDSYREFEAHVEKAHPEALQPQTP
jgi:hypothetical protein